MILGIDASTSVVGYTLLDKDGHLINAGYINIGGFENLLHKAVYIKKYFKEQFQDEIESVYIEDISKKFRPGFSSAQVITTLAKFNGIVSFIVFEIIGKIPKYIPASSARRLAYNRSFPKGIDIKKEVFKEVMKLEPELSFPLDRKGNPVKSSYDLCDSYTMARAGYNIERQ